MSRSKEVVSNQVMNYVIDIRRKIHSFPEISGEEVETINLITSELEKMGIFYEVIDNGGVIGIIEGKHTQKSIILRADIDALPMKEDQKNLKQKKKTVSNNPNAAHTCGHDGHTSMLLGAARILKEKQDQLEGRVILAFEQGEENGRGIYRLVKRLQEIGADGVWGIHLKPDIPSKKISVNAGPRTASQFIYHIRIKGVGGHGSRPDLANSPLDAFTDLYEKLKNMRINTLNPFDPITFSVGQVHFGSTQNIISDELEFSGTVRYLHHKQGIHANQEFKRLLQKTCDIHGCEFEYVKEPFAGDISVYNNEKCSDIATKAVKETEGEEGLYCAPAWMASETFSFYQKYFPGVFAFLGTENNVIGTGADNHDPKFDIDEETLKTGVAVTVKNALLFLENNEEIIFEKETRDIKKLIIEAGLTIY